MPKKIVLGVCSSISAYKACDLSRMFIKSGYEVQVVMSTNATKLICPLTFETLTDNPVYTDTFVREQRMMGHIALKDNAALFLIAPATANFIAKAAGGVADDLISTTYLSVTCPVVFAPAMNPNMWAHPAVQENIEKLKKRNHHIVSPGTGSAVCGDIGDGRLAEIEQIYEESIRFIQ